MQVDKIILLPLGVVGLMSLALLFCRPKQATWLLIALCVFDLGFFRRWFGAPAMISRVPYLIAIILGTRILSDYLIASRINFKQLEVLKVVFFFVGFIFLIFIFSNIYNNESMILGLYELRFYFLFLVLCISIFLYVPISQSIEFFLKSLIVIGLIQIPFTLIQNFAVTIFDFRSSSSALDMSSGTFSSYPPLVFLQCSAIGIVLTYHLWYKKQILKIGNYAAIILLVSPLLLSFSRIAMAFVFITIYTVYIRYIYVKKRFNVFLRNIFPAIVFPLIIFILFYNLFWKQHEFTEQLSLDYAIEYLFRDPKLRRDPHVKWDPVMGRGKAAIESVSITSQNIVTFFVGLGSGAVSKADFLRTKGNYFQEYGPLAGIGRTQFAKTMTELGWLGTIALAYYLISMFRLASKINFKGKRILCVDIWVVILSALLSTYFYTAILQFNIVLLIVAYLTAYTQKIILLEKNS